MVQLKADLCAANRVYACLNRNKKGDRSVHLASKSSVCFDLDFYCLLFGVAAA